MPRQQSSLLKRSWPLIIFILFSIVCVIAIVRMNTGDLNIREVPSPLIGKHVPEFELPLLNQTGTFSDKDFIGHVTLLNVWASWCYACRLEHQQVTKLSREGLRVVGFNYKDDAGDATAWLRQFGNPYEVVIRDADGRTGIDFGVYGAPETFLIDANGIIRHKVIGPLSDKNKLEKLMQALATITVARQ